jgi:hypothetical protein
MYGAELTWTGKAPEAKDYQLAINRMARGTIVAFPSTPLGPLLAESGLIPVGPLLDHRQSRYAQRILRQLEGTRGAKEILLQTKNSALSERLRKMTHLNGAKMEKTYLETGKTFEGDIIPDTQKSQAKNVAKEWNDWANTAWTDGSQLQDGRVGCSFVWKNPEGGRTGDGTHLGRCREVYDAELHAIARAVRYFATQDEENQHYTIFSDCKSAIQRCRNDTPGPGQALARMIIDGSLKLASNRC